MSQYVTHVTHPVTVAGIVYPQLQCPWDLASTFNPGFRIGFKLCKQNCCELLWHHLRTSGIILGCWRQDLLCSFYAGIGEERLDVSPAG